MTDPLYGSKKGPNGNQISGAAAFMNTVKEAGGPSQFVRDIAAIAGAAAGKAAFKEMRGDSQPSMPTRKTPRRPPSPLN